MEDTTLISHLIRYQLMFTHLIKHNLVIIVTVGLKASPTPGCWKLLSLHKLPH